MGFSHHQGGVAHLLPLYQLVLSHSKGPYLNLHLLTNRAITDEHQRDSVCVNANGGYVQR